MKKPLQKFDSFAATLFPAEVEHIRANNEISDPEILSIIEKLHILVNFPEKHSGFDAKIDPRKYSRIIKYFNTKLERIDVDAYYAWISKIDFLITTDAIPPEEQQRIRREVESFEPAWFHAASFYRTMQNYKRYLLIRFREKDYIIIKNFIENHADFYLENENIEKKIEELTSKFVLPENLNSAKSKKEDVKWLLDIFYNEEITKKNRYQALVAYNLYHISTRQITTMLEPMDELKKSLLKGEFYSRRILSNYYANKLLLRNYEGNLKKAAFCGLQSIKQFTEDYLYYLNNYCSVLMNMRRFEEVLQHSKASLSYYKLSQDGSRRVIFIANYCRCLNHYSDFKKSIRIAKRLYEELGNSIFQFKWHYFFRMYFFALVKDGRLSELLRLERKNKLAEQEQKSGLTPHLKIYTLVASFLEMKVTEIAFKENLQEILVCLSPEQKTDIDQLLTDTMRMAQ